MSCREKMESMNALICLTGPIAILTSWFHPAITLLRIVTFYFYAQHFGFVQYFESNRAIAFFENFWRFIVGLTMLLVEIPMLYKAAKEEENYRE
jgi:hypothetical protein